MRRTPVTGHPPRERRLRGAERAAAPWRARDVLVATNGYVDKAVPWLRRRLVPFHGYMVATEPLPRGNRSGACRRRAGLSSSSTTTSSSCAASPDGERLLFGGYTGGPVPNLKGMARACTGARPRIVPDLAGVRLSHAWTGKCAGTFDLYPHIGVHDGVHFALGYCFAGVPMGSWMGLKVALKIMGDGLPAPPSTTSPSPPCRSTPAIPGSCRW